MNPIFFCSRNTKSCVCVCMFCITKNKNQIEMDHYSTLLFLLDFQLDIQKQPNNINDDDIIEREKKLLN